MLFHYRGCTKPETWTKTILHFQTNSKDLGGWHWYGFYIDIFSLSEERIKMHMAFLKKKKKTHIAKKKMIVAGWFWLQDQHSPGWDILRIIPTKINCKSRLNIKNGRRRLLIPASIGIQRIWISRIYFINHRNYIILNA